MLEIGYLLRWDYIVLYIDAFQSVKNGQPFLTSLLRAEIHHKLRV